MNTWVQVIELILIYRSKIAFTSAVNSSKLAPIMATKPLMQMRGFFGFRLCRKLAFGRPWIRINAEEDNA
jgi:hypothetical protein